MANDVVFKSKAFGGFDKNEVMDFVNKILEEKASLDKRLSESNAKFAQVNSQLFELKRTVEENDDIRTELENVKASLIEVQNELSVKTEQIEALNTQINEKNTEIESLNSQLSETVTSDEVQLELDSLRAEVARLKVEAEKKKDLERQVGAAMLDARIHSEELVEEAKEKANAVTKSVYTAIGETALKIDDLSTGIGEIARSFTKSVEEVELRIKALTGDMSKTAQLLISDSGIISDSNEVEPQIEYDFAPVVDVEPEITINPADYGVEDVGNIDFSNEQIDE